MIIARVIGNLLLICFIILLVLFILDELEEHRDAREARYHACDMQVDAAKTRADTITTIQWCGDHGVLFEFNHRRPDAAVSKGK